MWSSMFYLDDAQNGPTADLYGVFMGTSHHEPAALLHPAAVVMYKEVPGYWQNGMNVREDVTLLWSDDNRGNIRRVPAAAEPAFFGLVLHPVLAGRTVVEIYTKAALATTYIGQHRASTNDFSRDVKTAFAMDQALMKRREADDDTAGATVVQLVPMANAGNEPAGWSPAVVASAYVKTSKLGGSLALASTSSAWPSPSWF
ncbi:hypothetical protein SCUCBS95973_000030 [Sporothrix curviconia]|uniref:Uncharacterized protein n=1 Tax=Sporothrix curviconia TaxID=1260050 RepID=A0ABP0AMM6_9PEZI